MRRLSAAVLLVGLTLVVRVAAVAPPRAAQALTPDALFQSTKVWTVNLTLSREAWETLSPVAPPPPAATAAPAPPPPPPAGGAPAGPPAIPPELVARLLKGFVASEGHRNGISGAMKGLDFQYVHASLDLDGRRFQDVGVRVKGNGTFLPQFGKPSLKIDLNKFVKGQKLAGVSRLNLQSNITDASWMNEVLAYRLYRDAGVPAPRTAYARVYVTVSGGQERKYLGLYGLVENVDEDFASARFGAPEGAVFKPVTPVPFKYSGNDWSAYDQMYDPKTALTASDRQRVIDFCDLVTNGTDAAFAAKVGEFLDLGAFAKYMAVLVWMANPDSILQQGQNYYVYLHPKNRTLSFVPWDQDHSWGQFVPFTPAETQQRMDLMHPWTRAFAMVAALDPYAEQLRNRFLERIFADDAFKRRYLAEMVTLTRTLTQYERLSAQVDELAQVIAPLMADEPMTGRTPAFKESLGLDVFRRPSAPDVVVTPLRTFVRLRQESVLSQLKALGVQ
ncbi:MAG: CotH kinase family protein [Vicinamibacterales bacterium]